MNASNHVLLATMGTQPQVVTIALHLLREDGVPIERVEVIHTSARGTDIGRALAALRQWIPAADGVDEPQPIISDGFASGAEIFADCALTCIPITRGGLPIPDVTDEEDANATAQTIFQVLKRLKLEGATVHFLIAGGRKPMSVYGHTAAQLLFDEGDVLYHLLSEGELMRTGRMVPEEGDSVRLVPIPVLRWTSNPVIRAHILAFEDPVSAVRRGTELVVRKDLRDIRRFVEQRLTERQREVAAQVVRGYSNSEVAANLGIEVRTVKSHLSSIYDALAAELGWDFDVTEKRGKLVAALYSYYERHWLQTQDGARP